MHDNDVLCAGRESALTHAAAALSIAESGTDSRMLVQGARWLGKTVLLRKIAELAMRKGFTVIEVDREREGNLAIALSTHRSPPSVRIGVVDSKQLQRHIEAQTVHGPVLVAGDDLHQADEELLHSLHSLGKRLRGWPVAWALTFQDLAGVDLTQYLDAGDKPARPLELDPLSADAVVDLIAQLTEAKPTPGLLAFARRAEGNPGLISHLIAGLRSEAELEVRAGEAHLKSQRLPGQVVRAVRDRLDRLSVECRQFVTAAAALGTVVALDGVAEVLGTSPAMLLPELEEAVHEGILTYRREVVVFTSAMLWEAIKTGLPRAVSDALRLPAARRPGARTESPVLDRNAERSAPTFNQTEWEMVRMVSEGMTNVQIARRLAKSEHTVNYHLQKIYRRMNVHSRAELVGRLRQEFI